MTPEELKAAMFKTRLEVFEKMYELKLATDPKEKKGSQQQDQGITKVTLLANQATEVFGE